MKDRVAKAVPQVKTPYGRKKLPARTQSKSSIDEVSICTEGIGYSYEDRAVLENLSLAVCKGSFVALTGPNGSGKTTLLRALCRVLEPSVGRVLLEGKDLCDVSRRDIARTISVVPQEAAKDFEFTALEMVLLGRIPHLRRLQLEGADDLRIAREAMERTGCLEFKDRLLSSLSGGEKQRVMIAQALAQEPSILLLDEPTLHLDLRFQLELMRLLGKLVSEGLSVVAVLHDLNLAIRFADSIVLLREGRVVAVGPPEIIVDETTIGRVFEAEVSVQIDQDGKPFIVPVCSNGHKESED